MIPSIGTSGGFQRAARRIERAWLLGAFALYALTLGILTLGTYARHQIARGVQMLRPPMRFQITWGIQTPRFPTRQELQSMWSWADPAQMALATLIAVCSLALWGVSLKMVDIRQMTDLGLVSALPIGCFIALGGLSLGFCLAILGARERTHTIVLTIYILALIFMLYATPALVEQSPRFQVTYWLSGHTEYILRNGSVDPFLDAYFNWPGFFVLTGLITSVIGAHSVLALASWASFFYNLIYFAPIYIIYSTATRDRRLIWLGLWLFYITDWVWQDYFSPQGLNLFLYLVMMAILLKWFRTSRATPTYVTVWTTSSSRLISVQTQPITLKAALNRYFARVRASFDTLRQPRIWLARLTPRVRAWLALSDTPLKAEERRQRIALLVALIGIFAFSVVSHPITPFFMLLSVLALTLFDQCTPRWLPFLMAAMIVGWDFTAASPYMAGHLAHDLAKFGNIQLTTSANVSNRLSVGSAAHQFIAQTRVLTTGGVWGLAAVGALLRWRRGSQWYASDSAWGVGSLFTHDLKYVFLMVTPLIMVAVQPYGGEMAMRSYLISLPIVSFFAAAAFCSPASSTYSRPFTAASVVMIATTCLLLLTGFMFARYGNERADYITYNETDAVSYLYSVAPANSLMLQGWTGTPWRYMDLERYAYEPLYNGDGSALALQNHEIKGIIGLASQHKYPAAYIIFTRSQEAQAEMFSGVPHSAFDAVEYALLSSGKFVLIYKNSDAEILMYVRPEKSQANALHPFTDTPIARGFWQ